MGVKVHVYMVLENVPTVDEFGEDKVKSRIRQNSVILQIGYG
jgi:hypothetical protein